MPVFLSFQITADKLIICREHMIEILRKRNASDNVFRSSTFDANYDDEAENMETENIAYDRNNNSNIFAGSTTTTMTNVDNQSASLLTSKENVSPCDSINGHVRKRQRRKSRGGDGQQRRIDGGDRTTTYDSCALARAKTASEQVFIDDIYDAVRVLYGMSG